MCILFVLLLFILVRVNIIGDIPSNEELLAIDNPLGSTVYAAKGEMIGRYFVENRGQLDTTDLTEFYKHALVATEDVRFYEHGGVDVRSLFRVFFKSILLQRDNSGGGSTLTQQLAKNLYPRKRYKILSMLINKFREMTIARKLEKLYEKNDLLLLYSNTVSFGERAFGLHTASHRFFNKDPKELDLLESSTLVGILKAPSYYSPRKYPERAEKRRNVVLKQMNKYGFLDDDDYLSCSQDSLMIDYQSLTETMGLARYFQQQLTKEFEQWANENPKEDGSVYDVNVDGLKIYTSLDYDLQLAAEQNMEEHMISLQKIFNASWKGGDLYGPKDAYLVGQLKRHPSYKKCIDQGMTEDSCLVQLESRDVRKYWTWEGMQEDSISVVDSVKNYLSLLHNGIFALDAKTGFIKVWVGGNDYGEFQWDNVMSPRQVGSTFKPVVYLTALERGVHPCDYFPNQLRTYSSYKDWTPQNADGLYGGYLSVTDALTHSVNTVSVQLLFQSGIDNVIKRAHEMGITAELPVVPSIVLGTADISLYDMVRTYGFLANGGHRLDPKCITKIEDSHGQIIYEFKKDDQAKRMAVDSTIMALNTMLSHVTAEGTGARLYTNYDVPFEVMGKTGTTQNQSDGWFISYTGDMVVGAWVGAQDRRIHFKNLGTGSGGRTALPLVGAVWEYAAIKGYRPKQEITMEMAFCLDSLGTEEYAMLREGYGEDRFDDIYDYRDPRTALEKLLDRESSEDIARDPRRTTRAPRRKSSNNSRTNKIEIFKKKVERALRKIGNGG